MPLAAASQATSPDAVPTAPTTLDEPAPEAPLLTRGKTLLLAVMAGASVAGLYYVQPLLARVAQDLHVSTGRASLLVTATQVGYVLGIALLVPLGDKVDRRSLSVGMLAASAATMGAASLAPTFWWFCAAMVAVGITASAAMVAVPFAAALAEPRVRARATGTVMSGLLLGVLLARTVSGLIAQASSWRAVFLVAAVAGLLLAGVVRWQLGADHEPKTQQSYPRLLASVVDVIRTQPPLRSRMALGFISMLSFSAMWTAFTFMLAANYHYDEGRIGLFGLVGAAGAAAAPLAGRLIDRGHAVLATSIGWVGIGAGWLLLWLGAHNLAALVIGLLVFDYATQSCQVTNQGRIYQLPAELRSRITTAYMTAFFFGGVTGSLVVGWAYTHGGWSRVCLVGLTATGLGGLLWLRAARRGH